MYINVYLHIYICVCRYGTLSLACGDAAAARGFLLQALEIAPAHAGALAGFDTHTCTHTRMHAHTHTHTHMHMHT